MRCITAWPALLLTGLAFADSPRDPSRTVAADFARETTEVLLTAESASWSGGPAAATIQVQVGSLYGSAVIPLVGQTTPRARTIEGHASSNDVHGLTNHKTVSISSCDTSFDYTKAASAAVLTSAAVPAGTAREATATGLSHFASTTGGANGNQTACANPTISVTTFNATTFNATTFNATTFNATTFNATTVIPPRGPLPTRPPPSLSLLSSAALSTRNGGGRLLVAALLQVGSVLLL